VNPERTRTDLQYRRTAKAVNSSACVERATAAIHGVPHRHGRSRIVCVLRQALCKCGVRRAIAPQALPCLMRGITGRRIDLGMNPRSMHRPGDDEDLVSESKGLLGRRDEGDDALVFSELRHHLGELVLGEARGGHADPVDAAGARPFDHRRLVTVEELGDVGGGGAAAVGSPNEAVW
jgi:hypothetical protein